MNRPFDARKPTRVLFGAVAAACVALALVALFAHAFTGRFSYDDEGYMLVSLRGWLSGHALYDEVFSQYGPGFFVVVGGAFRVFGHTVVSIEAARTATALIGLVTALSLGYATARVARSAPAGLLAGGVAALCFPIGIEAPLHPTHMVEALVGLSLVGVVVLDTRGKSRGAAVLVGVTVGLTALGKVNVGGVLVVALAAGMGVTARSARADVRLIAPVALAALVAVVAAAGDYQSQFVTLLALAALVVLVGARGVSVAESLPIRRPFVVASVAGLAVLVIAVATGTTLGALARGTVLDAAGQARAFTVEMTGGQLTLVALIAIAAVAALVDLQRRPVVSGIALVGMGASAFVAAYQLRYGSGLVHSVNMLAAGVATSWIVLRTTEDRVSSSRLVFSALGVLLPLQAYPVAGGQKSAGALMLPAIGAIAIVDGLRLLAAARAAVIERLIAPTLTAAAIVIGLAGAARAHHEWRDAAPLPLAGTHVRASPRDVAEVVDVSAALAQCETFFGMPGFNSFYLFADKQPPTWQNAGAWMMLFDRKRQARAVRDLQRAEGLCVLRNPTIEANWIHAGHEIKGPLRPFLESKTTLVATVGDYAVYR